MNERLFAIGIQMKLETGIDFDAIYCKFTGAPMGQLTDEETNFLWSTIDQTMDDDAIIDELYTRTIIAMRPSPAWNYIQRDTLDRIRQSNPTRLMAYLLARYYEPREGGYNRRFQSVNQHITNGINRIKAYQFLAACEWSEDDTQEFLIVLLLLDSEFDLAKVPMWKDIPKTPLDLDPTNLSSYIKAFHSFYLALSDKRNKQAKKEKLEAAYFQKHGNQLTRQVANRAFMDLKPKSESMLKREAKQSKIDDMTAILSALMNGAEPAEAVKSTTPATPVVKNIAPLRLKIPTLGVIK